MTREIYPNAPIALVACEIRLPSAGGPFASEIIGVLSEELAEPFPMAIPEQRQTFSIGDSGPQTEQQRVERFTNRARDSSVSLTPNAMVVETTNYEGYEAFRPLLASAIRAVTRALDPKGPLRIGLRYIDEIRVPRPLTSLADWKRYLSEAVTGVSALAAATDRLEPKGWQGQVAFKSGDGMTVVVRYGPREGLAVKPTGLVRRDRGSEPGPFFLFDVDSFWEPPAGIPEWDEAQLLKTCDTLHAPIRALFETVITDELRNEVLRARPGKGDER